MTAPMLTIAIPVYNGERFIDKTIKSILCQVGGNCRDCIEIIISDNGSTDHTYDIVNTYTQQYEFIRYFSNQQNYGYDRNVDLTMERSSGQYVWLLGCGEALHKDSIRQILAVINTDRPDVIISNFQIYSQKTNKIEEDLAMNLTQDITCTSLNDIVNICPGFSTALSTNIIRRCLWHSAASEELIESGWAHLERVYTIIARHQPQIKVRFVANPLFTLYRETDGWYSTPSIYYNFLNYNNILLQYATNYDSEALRKVLATNAKKPFYDYILLGKTVGVQFDKQLKEKTWLVFGPFIKNRLLATILMKLPSYIFRRIYRKKLIRKLISKLISMQLASSRQ